jgi:predicted Zn-dependent protease
MTIRRQGSPRGLSPEEARALTERVLGFSSADNARITVQSGRRRFIRSADNRITTAGDSEDVTINVMSVFGQQVASVTTNGLDDAAISAAVRRSEDLARIAPEDPEYLNELDAQEYPAVDAFYESTGEMPPDALAEAAAAEINAAKAASFVASGYVDVQTGSTAIATSNGLFAHHAETGVASTLTVRAPDGSSSGWAGDEAADWTRIETPRVAEDAVRKCRTWRGVTTLEPGEYDVVLEPSAAGMLMLRMGNAFNARPADEGRSFFSSPAGGNRFGEQLFDPRITIVSDPTHPDAETAPFTSEGIPRGRETWVENGVLRNLSYSRFWASRQGADAKPEGANLIMSGGDSTVDEMIRSTRRGVLITRFWYIRGLNPRTIAFTGLTRDGTFLIENGRISRPVNNFRFNQSLAEMLANVEMLGQPVRVAASENASVGTPVVVPAMKVRNFNLASISEAV